MLIDNKDDIGFVTEFPRFLGHPVHLLWELENWEIHVVVFHLLNMSLQSVPRNMTVARRSESRLRSWNKFVTFSRHPSLGISKI